MRLDQHLRARVLLLSNNQHFAKARLVRAAGCDRSIPFGLIDHQNVTWFRHRIVRIVGVVFGEVRFFDPGHGIAGAVQEPRVVKRRLGQQLFQIGSQ